jgi:hypothetical protein
MNSKGLRSFRVQKKLGAIANPVLFCRAFLVNLVNFLQADLH